MRIIVGQTLTYNEQSAKAVLSSSGLAPVYISTDDNELLFEISDLGVVTVRSKEKTDTMWKALTVMLDIQAHIQGMLNVSMCITFELTDGERTVKTSSLIDAVNWFKQDRCFELSVNCMGLVLLQTYNRLIVKQPMRGLERILDGASRAVAAYILYEVQNALKGA